MVSEEIKNYSPSLECISDGLFFTLTLLEEQLENIGCDVNKTSLKDVKYYTEKLRNKIKEG